MLWRRWKMPTRSYLDALSPGMRAKLDPLFRMEREQEMAGAITVTGNGSEPAFPKYSLRPGRRPASNVTTLQSPATKK
jgi:hypothetical protein